MSLNCLKTTKIGVWIYENSSIQDLTTFYITGEWGKGNDIYIWNIWNLKAMEFNYGYIIQTFNYINITNTPLPNI